MMSVSFARKTIRALKDEGFKFAGMVPGEEVGAIMILIGWSVLEGTKCKNNPLATSWSLPGSSQCPYVTTARVQQYPDEETGAKATAKTLMHYPSVLKALALGKPKHIQEGDINRYVTGSSSRKASYGPADIEREWKKLGGNPGGLESITSIPDELAEVPGEVVDAAKDAVTGWVGDFIGAVPWSRVAYVVIGIVAVGTSLYVIMQRAGKTTAAQVIQGAL